MNKVAAVFLEAARVVAEGEHEFSCNAISHAQVDNLGILSTAWVRLRYESLYLDPEVGTSLLRRLTDEHSEWYDSEARKNLRNHRVLMLLMAAQMARTGDLP